MKRMAGLVQYLIRNTKNILCSPLMEQAPIASQVIHRFVFETALYEIVLLLLIAKRIYLKTKNVYVV